VIPTFLTNCLQVLYFPINIPSQIDNIYLLSFTEGIYLTMDLTFLIWQGLRVYRDRLYERTDPRGKPYYWIGGDTRTGIPNKGSDLGALADDYVSITPLQFNLTAYPTLQMLNQWALCRRNGVAVKNNEAAYGTHG
jgi:broad specificity polyphosphatase/5'/3'-nucleotidase SurE